MSAPTDPPAGETVSRSLDAESRLPVLAEGIDSGVAHLLPEGLCRTFRVQPYALLHREPDTLGDPEQHAQGASDTQPVVLVATGEPDDPIALQVVRDRLRRPVWLVPHALPELMAAIERVHPARARTPETAEARLERAQLGDMLLASGLLDQQRLDDALAVQTGTGDPLSEVLVAEGFVEESVVVAALSELHQIQRVSLIDSPLDHETADRLPEPLAREHAALPVAVADSTVLLAVARPLVGEPLAEIEAHVGAPLRQLIAERREVDHLMQRAHGPHHVEVAESFLRETEPELAARPLLTAPQRLAALVLIALVVLAGWQWPADLARWTAATVSLVYLACCAQQLVLAHRGLAGRTELCPDAHLPGLPDSQLPRYTVLVPLHGDDAGHVATLLESLARLDYPRTRLEVRLLCVDDDFETRRALDDADLPPYAFVSVVPRAGARTRAQLCTVGLMQARGTHCVVYNVDDLPDDDQLRVAARCFADAPAHVIALQAKLNVALDDGRAGLVRGWASNELAGRFELLVAADTARDGLAELAGSSLHIATAPLRVAGAWDPHHDAPALDLALRLYRQGYRSRVLDSTTVSTGHATLGSWFRWLCRQTTGALETVLVHARHPRRLRRDVGTRGLAALGLWLAPHAARLANPLLWCVVSLASAHRLGLPVTAPPMPWTLVAVSLLLVGNLTATWIALLGNLRRREFGLTRAALLTPLWWALSSLAAWCGVVRLVLRREEP
ncbi:GspE/PulE/PilB domain-containing protein [Nocardioides acrostichi]|uniref:Glycosyltransferase n=1 Tax=Nocardioides acrostichi TaxID=2784339 RepID=A0A930YBG2_9ACTN|nr:glycosyltransferase [Nocardioides acrostichi]MBF4162443.1 glycosyltransferase [Nocardioides acrostichi]